MKLQKIQAYVRLLQRYNAVCTEKGRLMSALLKSEIT